MTHGVFSTAEIRVMREAFDTMRKQRPETPDLLANLIVRAARHGASNPDMLIDRVNLTLSNRKETK